MTNSDNNNDFEIFIDHLHQFLSDQTIRIIIATNNYETLLNIITPLINIDNTTLLGLHNLVRNFNINYEQFEIAIRRLPFDDNININMINIQEIWDDIIRIQ
jgi:hypothetical protein